MQYDLGQCVFLSIRVESLVRHSALSLYISICEIIARRSLFAIAGRLDISQESKDSFE